MKPQEETAIFVAALKKWPSNQPRQYIEEVGELLVADNHWRRGRTLTHKILEEVADVRTALKQFVVFLADKEGVDSDVFEEFLKAEEHANMIELERRVKEET